MSDDADEEVFDYGEDDLPRRELTGDELSRLGALAHEQTELEDEIAQIETELAAKQQRLRKVSEYEIPMLLKAARLTGISLEGGGKVEVSVKPKAELFKEPERRMEQVRWLDRHQMGAIVKRRIIGSFQREQEDLMTLATDALRGVSPRIEIVQSFDVHNGQLVAALKRAREAGVAFDDKFWGWYELRRTKIVRPKK